MRTQGAIRLFFKRLNKSTYFLARFPITQTSNGIDPCQHSQLSQNMATASQHDSIEKAKKLAATRAVDENINAQTTHIGIGSGSTMCYVLERVKQVSVELDIPIVCIPTSYQSKQLIHDYDMQLGTLDTNATLDVTIDGADEVDENLVAIKGGGACLAQEKVVAFNSKKFIVVADYRKNSNRLGISWKRGVPIEVLPMATNAVRCCLSHALKTHIDNLQVRIGKEKAGPVITDNGNFVIDWKFDTTVVRSPIDWRRLSNEVKLVPGVVETGIFVDMIDVAYFGMQDGSVHPQHANLTPKPHHVLASNFNGNGLLVDN